ncbi:MAG: glutamine--fructose-6-phosphate transaminase (isomerizing) [Candidatus Bathyarchaeia archaeon]
MCGIFGCVLKEGKAAPLIHAALKKLEYRGYDSVGEATLFNGVMYIKKDQGKIDDVHRELNLDDMEGSIGIGHTRWATHGAPYKVNAHPHTDCTNRIAVVHNGIVENFLEIRKELEALGHEFRSKTDTEVIPHLIEENMKKGMNLIEAVHETLKTIRGSYAIAVLSVFEPNTIICARNESPLIIGVSEEGTYCASDIPAFLPLTNKAVILENGEIAIIKSDKYEIWTIEDWKPVKREPEVIKWTAEMAEKQGYPHFMIKEIYEQPRCLRDTLRLQDLYLDLMATFLDRAGEVFLVAAGTSYHACLAASYMFSDLAFLATHPVISSEFIEQEGMAVNINSTILAVSQSGETTDTLAAVDYARNRAATILGLTNVVGSSLTRVSRVYIVQQSGPEIGVAATKTFTSQLSVLAQLALRVAKIRGKIGHRQIEELEEKIRQMPDIVEKTIKKNDPIAREVAKEFRDKQVFFFLGRGISSATAQEARLKLMEIAYVPSIAYPAGESKHGPISLIEPGFPVVFICPKDETRKTIIGNIMEMKARGATIISVIEEGDEEIKSLSDKYFEVAGSLPEMLTPIAFITPLQLLAYYMAVEKGLNPDKPRNLAKSVTVK